MYMYVTVQQMGIFVIEVKCKTCPVRLLTPLGGGAIVHVLQHMSEPGGFLLQYELDKEALNH